MADALIAGRDPGKETVEDKVYVPARRFGDEQDMGGTILYLASRAGSLCNGLVLLNDAGRLAVTQSTY